MTLEELKAAHAAMTKGRYVVLHSDQPVILGPTWDCGQSSRHAWLNYLSAELDTGTAPKIADYRRAAELLRKDTDHAD